MFPRATCWQNTSPSKGKTCLPASPTRIWRFGFSIKYKCENKFWLLDWKSQLSLPGRRQLGPVCSLHHVELPPRVLVEGRPITQCQNVFKLWYSVCWGQVWLSTLACSFRRRSQNVLRRRQHLLQTGAVFTWSTSGGIFQVMDQIRSKKVLPECECKKDCVGWELSSGS